MTTGLKQGQCVHTDRPSKATRAHGSFTKMLWRQKEKLLVQKDNQSDFTGGGSATRGSGTNQSGVLVPPSLVAWILLLYNLIRYLSEPIIFPTALRTFLCIFNSHEHNKGPGRLWNSLWQCWTFCKITGLVITKGWKGVGCQTASCHSGFFWGLIHQSEKCSFSLHTGRLPFHPPPHPPPTGM